MKVIIKNFQKKIPIYPKRIKQAILKTLSLEGIRKPGEITVCFVNDKKIKELNFKFLGKNSSTDVIAFNLTDTKDLKNVFADIVVSTDTAIRNTKIFKTTLFYELCLYVIHGLLHILGYNDKLKKQRQIMEKRQKEILKCLSIKPKP